MRFVGSQERYLEQDVDALKEGDSGPYGELAARALPAGLRLLFMPSLAALLDRAEQLTKTPLTDQQVLRIQDAAVAVITREDVARAMEAQRGYPEVDLLHAWETWQQLRNPID